MNAYWKTKNIKNSNNLIEFILLEFKMPSVYLSSKDNNYLQFVRLRIRIFIFWI